jgi:hypothetical protein
MGTAGDEKKMELPRVEMNVSGLAGRDTLAISAIIIGRASRSFRPRVGTEAGASGARCPTGAAVQHGGKEAGAGAALAQHLQGILPF